MSRSSVKSDACFSFTYCGAWGKHVLGCNMHVRLRIWSLCCCCRCGFASSSTSRVVQGPEPAQVQPSVACSRVRRARQPVNTYQQCGANCESCDKFERLASTRCFCTECHDKWDKEEKPSFETLMAVVSPEFRLVSRHHAPDARL